MPASTLVCFGSRAVASRERSPSAQQEGCGLFRKPDARERASDTLDDFDDDRTLEAGPFLFLSFPSWTTSQPDSAEATEPGPREGGAGAGGATGSGAVSNFFFSASSASSRSSDPLTDEAKSPHFSEEAELLELVSDSL